MQKSESILSHSHLREILHYSIITGEFYWIKSTGSRSKAGNIAGTLKLKGYRHIGINGKDYQAHRLAWFWVTGEWPVNEIDHKNGIKNSNYWINLRAATRSQNGCNVEMKLNNSSGYKGVSWNKAMQKWRAYITINQKQKHLGLFDNIEIAYAERLKTEKTMHGDFARV